MQSGRTSLDASAAFLTCGRRDSASFQPGNRINRRWRRYQRNVLTGLRLHPIDRAAIIRIIGRSQVAEVDAGPGGPGGASGVKAIQVPSPSPEALQSRAADDRGGWKVTHGLELVLGGGAAWAQGGTSTGGRRKLNGAKYLSLLPTFR